MPEFPKAHHTSANRLIVGDSILRESSYLNLRMARSTSLLSCKIFEVAVEVEFKSSVADR
jgi:hypothetical protein